MPGAACSLVFVKMREKQGPTSVQRVGHIKDSRVVLSKHSRLCSKPFIRWLRQNLEGMARTGLILALPGLHSHSLGNGLMATTGGSVTGCV